MRYKMRQQRGGRSVIADHGCLVDYEDHVAVLVSHRHESFLRTHRVETEYALMDGGGMLAREIGEYLCSPACGREQAMLYSGTREGADVCAGEGCLACAGISAQLVDETGWSGERCRGKRHYEKLLPFVGRVGEKREYIVGKAHDS